VLLITSTRFEEHVTPPGHPERMERAHVFDATARQWRSRGVTIESPRPATRAELARVHTDAHLEAMASTAGRAVMLDADTFTSPESYEVALLAAGAAVQAAEHAIARRESAFALVRPPGHHAERDRAMGFCLFNNIAVAAAHALARGVERVAIVDIDVHHGNGTQWMFYDDPRVLYMSTHQFPFYPGTGAASEVGTGAGTGFTFNVPLEAGATDADYDLVYRDAIVPVLRQFAPELVLVSAGFDAHESDPLASMRMTARGYGSIISRVAEAAPERVVALVAEGGYDLTALASCLDAAIGAAIELPEVAALTEDSVSLARGEVALASVRQAHRSFWPGL
jgi:acetoin utilization deacetylase AcuC-like enzyme